MIGKLRRTETAADLQRRATLDRLRSSKSDLSDGLDKQRAAATFEADPSTAMNDDSAKAFGSIESTGSASANFESKSPPVADTSDDTSYTARLLEAKRRAKKQSE